MKLPFFGVAILAFLLSAIAVYAYNNKNRFIDLLLAASAAFIFGLSMLLAGFVGAVRFVLMLRILSELLIVAAAVFLGIRLFDGLMVRIKGAMKSDKDSANDHNSTDKDANDSNENNDEKKVI
jgi:hypothetical protein